MEPTLKTLDEITDSDRSRVGGKAYNCARLKQGGFPVPDGLVVPADASDQDIAVLPEHRWFQSVPEGALFAVRSSGLAEDSAGDSFGEERLAASLEAVVDRTPEAIRDSVVSEVTAFAKGQPQHDDITMVILKFEDAEPGAPRDEADARQSAGVGGLVT